MCAEASPIERGWAAVLRASDAGRIWGPEWIARRTRSLWRPAEVHTRSKQRTTTNLGSVH